MDNIKNKKGLSITLVFKGQSLNYGEGIGNISELKKLTRIRKSVKLGNIQYDNFEFKPNKCPHCGEYINAIEYENGTVFFSRS